MTLTGLANRHSAAIDSLVGAFENQLRQILTKAQARTIAELQNRLSITAGMVDKTSANQKILRKAGDIFSEEMDRAGYEVLVNEFVSQFGEQIPFFQSALDLMGLPEVKFDSKDLDFFTAQQLNAADSLNAVVDTVSAIAQQKALFAVGGLSMADLAETLAGKLQQTVSQSAQIADTAITVFYRTVADQGFQKVEKDLDPGLVRYSYYGPDDKLTRPFCQRLVEGEKSYTRAEIEQMDNRQLPNVFLTCGGWRCRHQWLFQHKTPPADKKSPAVALPVAA